MRMCACRNPSAGDRARSALHLYIALIDFDAIGTTRTAFMTRLRKAGVGSQVHYIPVYRHPYYAQRYGVDPAEYPEAERYYRGCLSLPLYPDLTDEDVEHVVDDGARGRGRGMTDLSRIGLGTVQFGMHYGVSNRAGQPDEREVAAILERAVAHGVRYLDTASAYGDAEILLGRHLPAGHRLRIVTKTPPVPDEHIDARHKQQWLDALALSLDRLKVSAVYGLLVHQTGDLDKPGWQYLVEALREAQTRGLVSRIGVSVYDEKQLDAGGKPVSPRTGSIAAERARSPPDRVRCARAPEGAGQSKCTRARSSCRAFCSRRRPTCRTSSGRCASGLRSCAADGRGAGCRRWPRVSPSCCARRKSTRRSWA